MSLTSTIATGSTVLTLNRLDAEAKLGSDMRCKRCSPIVVDLMDDDGDAGDATAYAKAIRDIDEADMLLRSLDGVENSSRA